MGHTQLTKKQVRKGWRQWRKTSNHSWDRDKNNRETQKAPACCSVSHSEPTTEQQVLQLSAAGLGSGAAVMRDKGSGGKVVPKYLQADCNFALWKEQSNVCLSNKANLFTSYQCPNGTMVYFTEKVWIHAPAIPEKNRRKDTWFWG